MSSECAVHIYNTVFLFFAHLVTLISPSYGDTAAPSRLTCHWMLWLEGTLLQESPPHRGEEVCVSLWTWELRSGAKAPRRVSKGKLASIHRPHINWLRKSCSNSSRPPHWSQTWEVSSLARAWWPGLKSCGSVRYSVILLHPPCFSVPLVPISQSLSLHPLLPAETLLN